MGIATDQYGQPAGGSRQRGRRRITWLAVPAFVTAQRDLVLQGADGFAVGSEAQADLPKRAIAYP